MVMVWWSSAYVIHYSPLQPGKTLTTETLLSRNKSNVPKTMPGLMNKKGLILLHENARQYISQVISQKLSKFHVEVLPP